MFLRAFNIVALRIYINQTLKFFPGLGPITQPYITQLTLSTWRRTCDYYNQYPANAATAEAMPRWEGYQNCSRRSHSGPGYATPF